MPINDEIPSWIKWIGFLTVALGILPVVLVKPSPGVPLWIFYLGCSLFILTGIFLIAASFRLQRLATIATAGLLLAPLVLINWLAFGPGERSCTAGSNIPFLAELIGCRGGFIFFALLGWLVIGLGLLPGGKDKF